ncbi:MAG: galactokinase [Bacteroidaceae bacterium]|nr:galactokinase [Bacteroidaceae bacterium]
MLCQERFFEIYGRDSEGLAFCPQRVVPVGAHSDYGLGRSTGLALDKGIHLAYRPKKNGVIELVSVQFEKRAQWHIADIPETKAGDWADYLRGATIGLKQKHKLTTGLCGVIEGSLPIGGLSSSAAVCIVFITALARVNDIHLTRQELIHIALFAERNYVGVNVGTNDQAVEVFSKKDQLVYTDTQDDSYELIPTSSDMKPYEIAIFFSGLERSLAGTNLNMRVDELRSAAYALKAYAGMEYGKYEETYSRQVPREIFERFKDRLPDTWRRRAEHWYSEQKRVADAALAWRNGDIEEYGRLSFESGRSSIENWETGSPELKTLYDIMLRTDGIYGGRFSGAGFKGCCVALIDPAFRESVLQKVSAEYLKVFPGQKDKYRAFICHSADGVSV